MDRLRGVSTFAQKLRELSGLTRNPIQVTIACFNSQSDLTNNSLLNKELGRSKI